MPDDDETSVVFDYSPAAQASEEAYISVERCFASLSMTGGFASSQDDVAMNLIIQYVTD